MIYLPIKCKEIAVDFFNCIGLELIMLPLLPSITYIPPSLVNTNIDSPLSGIIGADSFLFLGISYSKALYATDITGNVCKESVINATDDDCTFTTAI